MWVTRTNPSRASDRLRRSWLGLRPETTTITGPGNRSFSEKNVENPDLNIKIFWGLLLGKIMWLNFEFFFGNCEYVEQVKKLKVLAGLKTQSLNKNMWSTKYTFRHKVFSWFLQEKTSYRTLCLFLSHLSRLSKTLCLVEVEECLCLFVWHVTLAKNFKFVRLRNCTKVFMSHHVINNFRYPIHINTCCGMYLRVSSIHVWAPEYRSI